MQSHFVVSVIVELGVNTEKAKHVVMSRHQNVGQSFNRKDSYWILWKRGEIQIFGRDSNKLEFDSWGS
jgi:hypothetical protein